VLQQRARELGIQLNQEINRVRQHYEAELRNASPARRQQLEQSRDQEIHELQQRYQLRPELTLVSLQEIMIPTVQHTLVVAGRDRPVYIQQAFVFDPLTNTVRTKHCDQCGQDREWAYCARGSHLSCGKCGTVKKCSHDGCNQGACDTHAILCSQCSKLVCPVHERVCWYCRSPRRYCEAHIISSFEGQDICPQCAHFCAECGQAFPPQRSTVCIVCSQDFCDGHSRVCPSCGKHHCQQHGVTPQHHTQIYCQRCVARCVSCHYQLLYLKADLQYCAECGSSLCRDHVGYCVSCEKVICATHTLITPQGKGCAACFAPCGTCQVVSHRSQLITCRYCPPGDRQLHCSSHSYTCVLCRQSMCDAHRMELYDGRMACSACAASCTTCQRYYPKANLRICWSCRNAFCQADSALCAECNKSFCNRHLHALADNRRACSGCSDICYACSRRFAQNQLSKCAKCHSLFCEGDSLQSQFRNEAYCKPHATDFVNCGGCDRRGPSPQLRTCALCGMPYCPHCIGASQNDRCNYCKNLRPLPNASDLTFWHRNFETTSLAGLSDSQRAEILNALAGMDPAFLFSSSECTRYSILQALWKPGFLNFFRRWFRRVTGFVLVRDKSSSRLQVRLNP
jgi:hypothetical protein